MNDAPNSEEPSIEEQMGQKVEPEVLSPATLKWLDLNDKMTKREPYRHERPNLYNTKFKELDGYEFWITPYNRIFIARGGQTAAPRQHYDGLLFDPPMPGVPPAVCKALIELLEKQAKIRRKFVDDDEYDESHLQFS